MRHAGAQVTVVHNRRTEHTTVFPRESPVRLSVRNKLLAGFGALIGLLLLSSLVSISKLGTLDERATFIGENSLVAVDLAGSVNTLTSDYRVAQLQHVFSDTEAEMAAHDEILERTGKAVADKLTAYEDTIFDAEDRRHFQAVSDTWDAYLEHTAPAIAASRRMQTEQAIRVLDGEGEKKFVTASEAALDLVAFNREAGNDATADAGAAYKSARTLSLVLLLVAVVTATAIALVLSRQIRSGVAQMLTAAKGIARGELDQNVTPRTRDELGDTALAFGEMIAYLRETADAAEAIGEGDLTVEVVPNSDKDELRVSMRKMADNLNGIVGELSSSAGTVSSASQQLTSTSEETSKAVTEIATAIGDVAQGAESQVRRVSEVREAMNEAVNAVLSSARSAEEAAVVAEQARETAQQGVMAVEQADAAMSAVQANSQDTAQAMADLADKSRQIGQFIQTITGIAEQTNLLALNAAIEAARAGEQGRGFAVVAEEVRKLAEESQKAAGTISGLVKEIQDETERTVDVVEDGVRRTEQGAETVAQARTAFEAIGLAVEDMTARIESIAAATQQITASTERVNEDIGGVATVAESSSATAEQVSASTQETSASAEEISASAQELSSTALLLEELVGRFKVRA